MCLSTVYLVEKDDKNVVMEDAANIACSEGTLEIRTLLGETKLLQGCAISEVNLLEHYAVITRIGVTNV